MDLHIGARWHHQIRKPSGSDRMGVELGIARALSGLLTTAWFGIVAHQLSVSQFGEVALVLSLGSLVSIGTDLGIPLALSKVACDHDRIDVGAIRAAVITRLVAGLVAGLVLIGLWVNAARADRWWMAGLYSISVAVSPFGESFLALLRGRAIGIVEATYNVVSKLALLAVGVTTLAAGWKPSGVVAAFVLVDVVSSLALPAFVKPRLSLTADPDPLQRAELRLRATLPLAAAGIIGSAYERVDIWLLAMLKGSGSVAVYVAAYKLYDTVLLPAMAMASAAVAAVGPDLAGNARPVARRLALRAIALAAPIALIVALLAPRLLRAAFGDHYGSASPAVDILMVAGLPGAALGVITPIALLARRNHVAKLTVVGLVGNVLANLLLVPSIGVKGAAVAFLVTDAALLVAFYTALPKAPVVPDTAALAASAP
ncbi:MAG TPA: oligosaccharide flippase family protein [Sporichthyaceae bacterium]|jgi:O-antigen/teichoic acid export membrane protein|nr:oligosaccharide flippase family protein [Sporichthyaceae bacterium]